MKLSIIVPVYDTEDTLGRCINSILAQTHPDIEVILVDDGSPDRSPQLCDEWTEKNRRICVIHKQNGGLSDARNAGINAATGDYLTFVDSDDYLAPDTYQPLMNLLEEHPEYDILEYPIWQHYGSPRQYMLDFPENTVYSNLSSYWLDGQAYNHTYACNKIYRKELFSEVRYPDNRVFEDAYTLPLLLQKAKTVATSNKGCYYYCENPNGITATADGQALSQLLEAHARIINRWNCDLPAYQHYYLHVLNIQMDVYELTGVAPILFSRPLQKDFFKGKDKLKVIVYNTIGINDICRLNKLIHRFWKSRS